MKDLTNYKFVSHQECFDFFIKFVLAVFNEIGVVFENEKNYRHIRMMAFYLSGMYFDNINKVANSEFKRQIINLPPRHCKSLVASIIFPAWILGHNPFAQIIVVSYHKRLSSHHIKNCKDIIQSPAFQNFFSKVKIDKKNNRALDFKVESSGGIFATSIASGAIGVGANFVIVDDPHNPSDVYSKKRLENTTNNFKMNFFSRLNRKESSMLIIMQRLHVNDLAGELLKDDVKKKWKHTSLELLNENEKKILLFDEEIIYAKGEILNDEVFDEEAIRDLKDDIGLSIFNAQYQQNPQIRDFALLNTEMINYINDIYIIPNDENYIQNNDEYEEKHKKTTSNSDSKTENLKQITKNTNDFYKISTESCQKSDIFEKNNLMQKYKTFLNPSEIALKCDSECGSIESINKYNTFDYIIFQINQKSQSKLSNQLECFQKNQFTSNNIKTQNQKKRIIHSWDTANSTGKNNFSVGMVWEIMGDNYYLIDLYRKQVDYQNLKKIVIDQYDRYGGVVLIEDRASGSALIQDLMSENRMTIIKCNPKISKESRFEEILHYFTSKKVFFPKNASWLADLENELFSFPYSKHDDQVDSISQFFSWVKNKQKIEKKISMMIL